MLNYHLNQGEYPVQVALLFLGRADGETCSPKGSHA